MATATKKAASKKSAAKKTASKKTARKAAPKKNKLGVKNSLVNNINAKKKEGTSKTKKPIRTCRIIGVKSKWSIKENNC